MKEEDGWIQTEEVIHQQTQHPDKQQKLHVRRKMVTLMAANERTAPQPAPG